MATVFYGQDPCDDQNAIIFHTPCGDEFQLCMDRYELENHNTIELQVHTNDIGQIDKCASYICSPCSHGTLEKMPSPNCNYMYTPDDGFYGNDTFYYTLVINDSCSDDPCEGKIWTVKSRYTGSNGLYVKATYKNANEWIPFDDVYNLQWGDYFTIDGSSLPVSQANWKYKFYEPEGTDGCVGEDCLVEEVIVHTSCSEEIFGKNYGLFRVVSGCTAGPNDGLDCQENLPSFVQENNEGSGNIITTQYQDTTMVVITVPIILSIEISDFKAIATRHGNLISWDIESVINEDYIEIQKSYSETNFEPIARVSPIRLGLNTYIDTDVKNGANTYYRLAIVSLDGNIKYSEMIGVIRHDISNMKIYPNPTNNDIIIDTGNEDVKVVEIAIIDMTGKMITRKTLPPSSHQLVQLSNYDLIIGIYVVQISTDDGQTVSKELMYHKELDK